MEFPDYVPAAIQMHLRTLIHGNARQPWGWAASLSSAEEALSKVERAIADRTRREEHDYLPGLRLQKADALKHRDVIAAEVACLTRLAVDVRMREAYSCLSVENLNDQQLRGFVSAAWSARINYSQLRERHRQASAIADEIAGAADNLRVLLLRFAATGVVGPGEFFSVPELLRNTDSNEMDGRNLHMWRGLRKHVLGDQIEQPTPPIDDGGAPIGKIEIVAMKESDKDDPTAVVRYSWSTAPQFPELLATVATTARDFLPKETGMIGAAIETRQANEKTDYLRAFANALTDSYQFEISPNLRNAIAIVANVVINLPDVDTTRDDVRKALNRSK